MGIYLFEDEEESPPETPGEVGSQGAAQVIRGAYDPVMVALRTTNYGASSSTPARVSAAQVWRLIQEDDTIRVAISQGVGVAGISRLSADQIISLCYDPILHALRVVTDLANVTLGPRLSAAQKIQAAYSPADRALSAEYLGETSGLGGSRLSVEQILARVISSATGKLQLVG